MARIVKIIEKTVSLSSGMRNADISFDEMTASALVVVSDVIRNGKPVTGLAFDSIGRYAHGALLKERFIPRVMSADPKSYASEDGQGIDPFKVWAIAMRNEKAGGHGERAGAVGLLDCAIWDLQSKLEEKPLWKVLNERFPGAKTPSRTPVYASGGHYREGDPVEGVRAEVAAYHDLGYRRFKVKAGGVALATDIARIEALIDLTGESGKLSIDLNAGLTAANFEESMAAFAPYGLAWVEEPCDPLDYKLLSEIVGVYSAPVATGENIFSLPDTKNLLRHGGMRPEIDLLNVDISLSYGITDYVRILDMMKTFGWHPSACIPHAGHLLSLHAAAGLGLGGHETAPGHDLIGGFPEDYKLVDGHITLSDIPGVGLDRKTSLASIFADMI